MTKSTKHKRERKENLKKIKLKVGKKLKKAQNETKTDFKARKIIMKEQLPKRSKSVLTTKKCLNVTELLSRISHHSVYVRQDGLNGLKELVLTNTKEELGRYLSAMFRGLNPCLIDGDHLVRMTSIKLIEALLMKIGNMIQPYFKLLTSYLSCAMVHLNTSVQSDSLHLMDVLLSHATSLTAHSANTILKNFFLLISRKIDVQSKSNDNVESYTLISNPSSRLASIKWRVKLLKSLSRYLESILGEKKKLEASVPVSTWQVIIVGCLPSLVKDESSRVSVQGMKVLTEETEVKSFVEKILPLLFQAWGEVGHSSSQKVSAGTPLEPVAIELLRCISQIILHLWHMTEVVTRQNPADCGWLMEHLNKKLESELLDGFPYCALESSCDFKNKSAKNRTQMDYVTECQHLNINLASLSFLYKNKNQEMKNNIAQYYIDFLSTGTHTWDHKLDRVVSTASSLLKSTSGLSINMAEELLGAALHCYIELKDKSRNALLQFPLQASDHTSKYLWRSPVLAEWISVVVENATANPKDEPHLELMLQFKLRNTPGFARIFSQKKNALKENLKPGAEGLNLIVVV